MNHPPPPFPRPHLKLRTLGVAIAFIAIANACGRLITSSFLPRGAKLDPMTEWAFFLCTNFVAGCFVVGQLHTCWTEDIERYREGNGPWTWGERVRHDGPIF
jgi:hypothetical protein